MSDTRKLIDQAIIIEGLLRAIEARNGQASPDELALLNAKFDEFSEMFYNNFSSTDLYGSEAIIAEEEVEHNATPAPPSDWASAPDMVWGQSDMAQRSPTRQLQHPMDSTLEPQASTITQPFCQTNQQPPRVDEALSRRKAENLSKAFTINDRYRFSQELYSGNNELMNEQIAAIDNFNTFQQACDLLLYANNWDPENPVVKEFLEIIGRHFQQ